MGIGYYPTCFAAISSLFPELTLPLDAVDVSFELTRGGGLCSAGAATLSLSPGQPSAPAVRKSASLTHRSGLWSPPFALALPAASVVTTSCDGCHVPASSLATLGKLELLRTRRRASGRCTTALSGARECRRVESFSEPQRENGGEAACDSLMSRGDVAAGGAGHECTRVAP